MIESSELYKHFQKCQRRTPSTVTAEELLNAEWLVNKASEYNNCYVFTDVENQQNYLYGQLMILKKMKHQLACKLKDFFENDSNGKEKTESSLLTLKRNNLSEYILLGRNSKRFQRIELTKL